MGDSNVLKQKLHDREIVQIVQMRLELGEVGQREAL